LLCNFAFCDVQLYCSGSLLKSNKSVGVGWFRTSRKCSTHLSACSLSDVKSRPSLLFIGTVVLLRAPSVRGLSCTASSNHFCQLLPVLLCSFPQPVSLVPSTALLYFRIQMPIFLVFAFPLLDVLCSIPCMLGILSFINQFPCVTCNPISVVCNRRPTSINVGQRQAVFSVSS